MPAKSPAICLPVLDPICQSPTAPNSISDQGKEFDLILRIRGEWSWQRSTRARLWIYSCQPCPVFHLIRKNEFPQTQAKWEKKQIPRWPLGSSLPCPGIRDPESFTPASLLIIDSVRSPNTDPKKVKNPKDIALEAQRKETFRGTKENVHVRFSSCQQNNQPRLALNIKGLNGNDYFHINNTVNLRVTSTCMGTLSFSRESVSKKSTSAPWTILQARPCQATCQQNFKDVL